MIDVEQPTTTLGQRQADVIQRFSSTRHTIGYRYRGGGDDGRSLFTIFQIYLFLIHFIDAI